MAVVCNALLAVLLLAGSCNPQNTPGTNLASSQQNYDNGFDNPFLKSLSPNWKGPKYWWLTSVKKDHFQTVFSNATSNPEINIKDLNLIHRTDRENLSQRVPSSSEPNLEAEILLSFGNTTSTSSPVDTHHEPSGEGHGDQSLLDTIVKLPPCDCLKAYQCFDNGTIKMLGEGLLGDRTKFPKSDTDCAPDERYCCVPETPMTQIGCGRQPPNLYPGLFADRILPHSNEDTYPGEFPWMVTLLVNKTVEGPDNLYLPNYYRCGGAIIDESIVITAAHCLGNKVTKENYPPAALKVRAGLWNLLNGHHEKKFIQDRFVRDTVIHPEYVRSILVYDYALLLLSEPFDFETGNVGKICLPETEEDLSQSQECIVTGWGKNKLGKDSGLRPILKKLNIPLVDHNECQRKLRTTRLNKYFKLHDSFICGSGIAGLDTCSGDGGSPLVCKPPGGSVFHLTGLVSWGIDCGTEIPGVYANVGKNVKWIVDTKRDLLKKL